MSSIDIETLQKRLLELRIEHRTLDTQIGGMLTNPYLDQLELQRLKKRKLHVKDAIARLQSQLIPDLEG